MPLNSSATILRCISAVTLATRDMAKSVAFYQSLGFEIRYGGTEQPFTSFAVGADSLNLIACQNDTPWPWWGRTIIYVGNVDRFFEHAVANGLKPSSRPRDAEWGERYFHITDPDGHELSFAAPLEVQAK